MLNDDDDDGMSGKKEVDVDFELSSEVVDSTNDVVVVVVAIDADVDVMT